jgi:sigma-B regulation protein RsbU (phosphoserine phosphatase)
MVMANLQATVRGQAFFNTTSRKCLERSNKLLFHSTDKKIFVSLFYGILDTEKNTLSYANAGHNEPILFPAGKQNVLLKTRGLALGLKENTFYKDDEIFMNSGDILLIYSDGISEAMNDKMEEFGDEKIRKIVKNNKNVSSGVLIEKILAQANTHFSGTNQNDDMTIIVIKRN